MGLNLGKLIKQAAPIAIGALMPTSAGMNPFITSALASGIGGIALGQKPKDALRSALIGGIAGGTMSKFAPGAEQTGIMKGASGVTAKDIAASNPTGAMPGTKGFTAPVTKTSAPPVFTAPTGETMSGKLLAKFPGLSGSEDDPSLLFNILNSQLGEGLAAGLLAQLLAGGDEDDTQSLGSFERRAFGAGGPGGKLGGINYMAEGGDPMYFPRRNGGIGPGEGSGTKDDVPALLMDGEFVMTRDAVKGAGGGSLKKGINNMYDMMDNFERMA